MNVPNFISLGLNCILMVSWWKLAINQSDGMTKPSPSNGQYCDLRQNWKYIQRRGLSCIVHHFDYLMVTLLLILAGDVETNLGPGQGENQFTSFFKMMEPQNSIQ